MTADQLARDNLLGICAAIGEDFGFNPDWLRVALAGALLWDAGIVIAVYAALGALVLASRLLFPRRQVRAATVLALPAPAAAEPAPDYALAA